MQTYRLNAKPEAVLMLRRARPCALALALSGALGCAEEQAQWTMQDSAASVPRSDGGALADAGDAGAPAGDSLEVTVSQGKLRGKLLGTTRGFFGIPYGKPPAGELRFAPPEPAESWTGTRMATEFGPSCPQNMSALAAMGAQDEDCLSLNVYAPVQADELPVMVFIHGGAFVAGGSSQYNGERLAEEGPVVVVTINYRLGVLGFLSHPALDDARDVPSGNDALRDQQLALRWVQDNIAKFGGDSSNVTVFGESAGSMSACLQMVSPPSRALAQRFIMESGACSGLLEDGKEAANVTGQEFADAFCAGEADVVACLRGQDPQQLVMWGADRGVTGAGWAPVPNPDDEVLPARPHQLVASGEYNKAPFIIGSNKNEWGLFQLIGQGRADSVAQLELLIDAQFGDRAEAIKAHYTATDATANDVFVRLMTDTLFRCPTRELARSASAQGSEVYLYSFEEGQAFHAFELPFVFGGMSTALPVMVVESLRETIQSYWTVFAKTGDPNGEDQPEWPLYDEESDRHMTLKAESEVGDALAKDDCDFWAQMQASQD